MVVYRDASLTLLGIGDLYFFSFASVIWIIAAPQGGFISLVRTRNKKLEKISQFSKVPSLLDVMYWSLYSACRKIKTEFQLRPMLFQSC